MNHTRRKLGVSVIAVLAFLFSSPVAFAGIEIVCGGESANYVDCNFSPPIQYISATYLDSRLVGYYQNDVIFSSLISPVYSFILPVSSIPDYDNGALYHFFAIPNGVPTPTMNDALNSGLFDSISFSGDVVNLPFSYDHVSGTYPFYYTTPPIPFSSLALRVFTPTSSRQFLASMGSSTAITGSSLWPLVAVALSIPLTFFVIHKIMDLYRPEKTIVKPQKVGYTVKL